MKTDATRQGLETNPAGQEGPGGTVSGNSPSILTQKGHEYGRQERRHAARSEGEPRGEPQREGRAADSATKVVPQSPGRPRGRTDGEKRVLPLPFYENHSKDAGRTAGASAEGGPGGMSRRRAMAAGSAILGAVFGARSLQGALAPFRRKPTQKRLVMYRLSLKGRRGSNAAKKHDASLRFATMKAAHLHRAHPGDNSRIVKVSVGVKEYLRLFVKRRSLVADLRRLV